MAKKIFLPESAAPAASTTPTDIDETSATSNKFPANEYSIASGAEIEFCNSTGTAIAVTLSDQSNISLTLVAGTTSTYTVSYMGTNTSGTVNVTVADGGSQPPTSTSMTITSSPPPGGTNDKK